MPRTNIFALGGGSPPNPFLSIPKLQRHSLPPGEGIKERERDAAKPQKKSCFPPDFLSSFLNKRRRGKSDALVSLRVLSLSLSLSLLCQSIILLSAKAKKTDSRTNTRSSSSPTRFFPQGDWRALKMQPEK